MLSLRKEFGVVLRKADLSKPESDFFFFWGYYHRTIIPSMKGIDAVAGDGE